MDKSQKHNGKRQQKKQEAENVYSKIPFIQNFKTCKGMIDPFHKSSRSYLFPNLEFGFFS